MNLSAAPIEPRHFAIPGKLHVVISFMLQFMGALGILGILPSVLSGRGISLALAWIASVVILVIFFLLVGIFGKFVPVRCKGCSGVARYRGVGWWPFIYWYDCKACGMSRRIEVQGR